MEVRQATIQDAQGVLEIYNYQVLNTASTFDLVPRTLAEQETYILERTGGLCLLVAEAGDGQIAGFAGLSFYRDRPGYRTTVEDSIYIHQEHQGLGVGDLLMTELIAEAQRSGFHTIVARIADAQPASTGLHQKHGFELVGVEREVGRKLGRWRDVAILQLLL